MSDANNELENSLLNKLVIENEDDQREIKMREKRIKDNEALIRALKLKLGVANPTNKESAYGSKVQIVQKIIDALPKTQFTQNDVEDVLRETYPDMEINRNRIRAVIWSLNQRRKTIKLLRKGNNREPALFEKLTVGAGSGANTTPSVRSTPVRKQMET